MDLRQLSLRQRGTLQALGTKALTAGGTAKGTAAGSIKTVNTVTYMHDGILRSKAATDNIALTGAAFTGQTVFFLLSADKSGNLTVSRGLGSAESLPSGVAAITNTAGQVVAPPGEIPAVPLATGQNGDSQPNCPFAIIKVVAAGGTTFTPGTTNVDAAGITTTFYDVSGIPEKGSTGL